ncbi:MAG: ParA family protein [Planctomycetes bacterium]|nr:ParA family protein [Planctomycetota bacterium]
MANTTGRAKEQTRTIAVMNQKGGVGKTTTTVNLGAAIASAGKRVCLIDLDPQAHLTLHLGLDHQQVEKSVYDLLIDPDCLAEQCIINSANNLDVIASEVDLAAAEAELASHPQKQKILFEKFQVISHNYDVVLIDCPPSLGLLTLNALALADEVFVPLQAHFLALQGLGKLLETVAMVAQSVNPEIQVTCVPLCMHEKQTTLAKEVVADLEEFFVTARDQDVPWRNCRLLSPPIRRNIKLAEAPSFGQTIFDYSPQCAGAADYRKMAKRLIHQWKVEAAALEKAERKTTKKKVAKAAYKTTPKADSTVEFIPKADGKVDKIMDEPAAIDEPVGTAENSGP